MPENEESYEEKEKARNDAKNIAMQDGVGRAKWRVGIGLSAIAIFALTTLVFVIILFLPYTPMKIYSYDIKPTKACPNQLLRAQLSYSIQEDVPIKSAESQAMWTAINVPGYEKGNTLVGSQASIPTGQLEPGRVTEEGEILRPAPVTSGTWQFSSEIVLHGKATTQIQRITTKAESVTTVLPSSDPRCKGGV